MGSHFTGIANQVENLSDFLGILMFDKWTCNTDHREVVFLPRRATVGTRYRMMMVDNGSALMVSIGTSPTLPSSVSITTGQSTGILMTSGALKIGYVSWK